MRLSTAIDNLGQVKAEIAALEILERSLSEEVKSQLLIDGQRAAEGSHYRATLTTTERVSVNGKAVAKLYPREAHPELYQSSYVESLRVVARTGEPILEAA